MIAAYILVVAFTGAGMVNPVPPLADMASCEKVRAAISNTFVRESSKCVQVFLPTK